MAGRKEGRSFCFYNPPPQKKEKEGKSLSRYTKLTDSDTHLRERERQGEKWGG